MAIAFLLGNNIPPYSYDIYWPTNSLKNIWNAKDDVDTICTSERLLCFQGIK